MGQLITLQSYILNRTKFDIIAISESKLDDNISDAKICIPNYQSFRLERNCYGGGVLFYCNENILCFILPNLISGDFESLWIKIKPKILKPIFYL